jgi:hypothetical protein
MMYDYGGYMGGGGLIWLVVMAALLIVPFWKILPRSGIPNWVAIFAIIPLIALILLWVVAFKDQVESDGSGN